MRAYSSSALAVSIIPLCAQNGNVKDKVVPSIPQGGDDHPYDTLG